MENLADPYKLALILAVFSALISMFACLYVWISDNRQYLQAQTINDAMRRVEGRVERLGVRDKFADEMYQLLSLHDQLDKKNVDDHKARHFLMVFHDYMYRAYCDWRDNLLDDREFGRLVVQYVTFWYAENSMAGRDSQEWWHELAVGFQDPGFQFFMKETLNIATDYQADPESCQAFLYKADMLLEVVMTGKRMDDGLIEEDPIAKHIDTVNYGDANEDISSNKKMKTQSVDASLNMEWFDEASKVSSKVQLV